MAVGTAVWVQVGTLNKAWYPGVVVATAWDGRIDVSYRVGGTIKSALFDANRVKTRGVLA